MKIELTSTTKIVELLVNGGVVPARIWEGHTEHGIPVHCYVTRIAAPVLADQSQFEAELKEAHAEPSDAIRAIPLKMVI